jgi:oxygen-independent coproporphyrinogen-3 oxidase
MTAPFALYVHVPWCRHVCPYCDFNVYASSAPPEEDYTAGLLDELTAWVASPPFAGRRARTVYLGGGTPSLFSPRAVGTLLDGIARLVGLEPDAEVTLEANPGTVTRDGLAAYRTAGVNRLSLGAQTFALHLLATLGRDHGPDDTQRAVEAARQAGIANLSLDLIYAVPGQRLAECDADLDAVVALGPEHVSAYALTWEAGTPFQRRRAAGRLAPVAEDDEAAMAAAVAARLPAAGLARYEISSWARPGRESRHNRSYWDGTDYLGLGAGAHSYAADPFPGRRWRNLRLPPEWRAAVASRGTAIADEERLTDAQARGEFCFTGLRQTAGIDMAAFAHRFGVSLEAAFPHVARLAGEGLVERSGERLRLTARGLLFADSVAATFV